MLEGIPKDVSVRGQVIERVQLTGSQEFKEKVFEILMNEDWRIIRAGPRPIPGEVKVDVTTFFIVAEREKHL